MQEKFPGRIGHIVLRNALLSDDLDLTKQVSICVITAFPFDHNPRASIVLNASLFISYQSRSVPESPPALHDVFTGLCLRASEERTVTSASTLFICMQLMLTFPISDSELLETLHCSPDTRTRIVSPNSR